MTRRLERSSSSCSVIGASVAILARRSKQANLHDSSMETNAVRSRRNPPGRDRFAITALKDLGIVGALAFLIWLIAIYVFELQAPPARGGKLSPDLYQPAFRDLAFVSQLSDIMKPVLWITGVTTAFILAILHGKRLAMARKKHITPERQV